MNATTASLERRALSLGTANAIDFALQFALPIVLTRTLDPHAFGEYRLLWLAVSTLMLVTPMCMAPALYYFLPRSDAPAKRLYINQTMLFLVGAGLASAWILSTGNPFLPGKIEGMLEAHGAVVPAFALAWVFASMLDVLPTAEERVGWQAKVVVSLAAIRAVALSLTAIVTRELGPVLWMLLAFATLKAGLVIVYVARNHGLAGPVARRDTFAAQLKQAAPFALSGTLHGVRSQGDQWIAAALFTVTQFASFSVATVLAPIVQIFRQSVNHVFLPSMSRLQSEGDFRAMLALNSRANDMVALLVYPLLAFAFVFAEEIITLIYTRTYLDAVPVLRLYSLALVAFVVEVVSVLFVLKQGAFAARVNGLVLLIALPMSWFGATHWGLVGAASGSVAAIYAERVLSLTRIALLTGTPVSKLQDWNVLGSLLGAAALSAGLAGFVLHWAPWSSFARLVSAAATVAATYPLALRLFGQGGQLTQLIASLRNKAPA
ncbi:MAG: oligosaccharide flippase family protein [Usitatibacter sp.]